MITNEDIVSAIKLNQNKSDNLALLYSMNKGIIYSVAASMKSLGVEIDDLTQEAYFAIVKAVEQYDEQQGSFANYAALWVKWWLVRYIENNGSTVRIPAYQRERIRKYKLTCDNYRRDHGRDPTKEEISKTMQITQGQVDDIVRDAAMLTLQSLDAPVDGSDGELSLNEVIPDQEDEIGNLDDKLQRQQLKSDLDDAMSQTLNEKMQAVLHGRYYEGTSQSELAKKMGCSNTYISQLERAALKKLRDGACSKKLHFYINPDDIETSARIRSSFTYFRDNHASCVEYVVIKAERDAMHKNREVE